MYREPTAPSGERSVVGRAMSILAAFDADNPLLTASDLSRRSGLPIATTHRLATKLVALGALERRGEGRYCVGLRLWQLASLSPPSHLRQAALPHLLRLSVQTRSTVLLAVRDAAEMVYLEVLPGQLNPTELPRPGSRCALDSSGTGMILLAHADGVTQHMVASRPGVDADRLRECLARVRSSGHAVAEGKPHRAAIEVATAVRNTQGQVVAAVGLASRTDRAHLPGVVDVLLRAADALSGKDY
ncbi:IclR family transcriptional regulator [Streptomyces sp. NPDC054841]